MSSHFRFDEVGRLPLPGDNVAIATRLLEAGTSIDYGGQTFVLDYTVMEGHRFAVKTIDPGENLLSWELPFGVALQTIRPGNYVINREVLEELSVRSLPFALPSTPNFADQIAPYVFDEASFQPAPPPVRYPEPRTFLGYRRSPARGVGTRNVVVLLGTTSRTASYVRALAARLQGELRHYPHIDGIVPAAHTEGGEETPNNLQLLLRTLSGFMVNPNVGAVLAVDYGVEAVTNRMVEAYLREHDDPLDEVPHRFLTLDGNFQEQLAKGEAIVREWLPVVNRAERTPESVSHLKIGMQCGGSDAFSGISANPLLGWISEQLVRYGGSANLAETDELIGAEAYVLQKVRDVETAHKFLALVDEFKTRAAWHGANAEGNPSGGNKYRGLYNIYLKSIGAARKKDPATRLDYAIEYGARMKQPGFYFMDSPGNDLESIAGQIAAGCNLIFFTTGNGSITNFPFVPTVKVVTTTRRFQLLEKDMDVNAGVYQEGVPMEELGEQTLELMLNIASGQRSVGEQAGHAQVQIWRNWRQKDGSRLDALLREPKRSGAPIAILTHGAVRQDIGPVTWFRHNGRLSSDQVGLILPTSLCASQVANMIVAKLNDKGIGRPDRLSRFVSLPHTEGCGSSGGSGSLDQLYARTMVGYATHPMVKFGLLLEHGCEKTHNAYMRHQIEEFGGDSSRLGFASIQLDGGIEKVTRKVEAWFAERVNADAPTARETAGLAPLRVALLCDGVPSAAAAGLLATITQTIVGAGGTVVLPENSPLLASPAYCGPLAISSAVPPSIAYGEHAVQSGFHIMATPTNHWVEMLTGIAATGVEMMIAWIQERPMQAHPLVPMLQVSAEAEARPSYANDLDVLLAGAAPAWAGQLLRRCKDVIEHRYAPKLYQQGNIDFQFTRGLLGVSL